MVLLEGVADTWHPALCVWETVLQAAASWGCALLCLLFVQAPCNLLLHSTVASKGALLPSHSHGTTVSKVSLLLLHSY